MPLHKLTLRVTSVLVFALLCSGICTAQVAPTRHRQNRRRPVPTYRSTPSVALSPGSWSQLAKLMVKGYTNGLGQEIAVSGETVVAGTYPTYSKAAYVFLGSATGWRNSLPVAALGLPASDTHSFASVAIDGDTIVFGSPSDDPSHPSYVLVYIKPSSGWTDMFPTATLTSSDTEDGSFGQSVSINGDTIVVGDDPPFGTSPGDAYVYVKPSGGWTNMTQTAKLTPSDGLVNDSFGCSVSVNGSTIVVGANQSPFGIGKAYVFVQPVGGWTDMTQTAELTASDAATGADVGGSVSVAGDNILIGASNIYNLSYPPGRAYVYTKPEAGWSNMTQTAELSAADPRGANFFGGSVSISGKLAAVGASSRGIPPYDSQGGVYIFEEPLGGWQNAKGDIVLTASDVHISARLGSSVSISGKIVVGGSDLLYPGFVYVFGLP